MRKRSFFPVGAALYALMLCAADSIALENGLARTPPMGFNTWNWFLCGDYGDHGLINESLILGIANSFVTTGMKAAGYQYVNIDDCWGEKGRDARGGLVANMTNFPRGIKYVADSVHKLGLKIGIYTDVADLTCSQKMPGMKDHENQDADTFVSWGIDYVKVDFCRATTASLPAYVKVRNALRGSPARMKPTVPTAHELVFSICNWGAESPWLWADTVGNLWRTTRDIGYYWAEITAILDENAPLSRYAGPGHWNDPDMLMVGIGRDFSAREDSTHFALWCMLAAPLLAGNDLRNMNAATKGILTHPEVIAIDQDSLGWQARRVRNASNVELWYRRLLTRDPSGQMVRDSTKMKKAVCIFNRGTAPISMYDILRSYACEFGPVTGPIQTYIVRDVWKRKVVDTMDGAGYRYNTAIASHGNALLLFTPYDGVEVLEPARAPNSLIASKIQSRIAANGMEVYVPVKAQVSMFDVQGKQIASFFTTGQAGQWHTVSCNPVVGGTYIIKAAVQGRSIARTIVLTR